MNLSWRSLVVRGIVIFTAGLASAAVLSAFFCLEYSWKTQLGSGGGLSLNAGRLRFASLNALSTRTRVGLSCGRCTDPFAWGAPVIGWTKGPGYWSFHLVLWIPLSACIALMLWGLLSKRTRRPSGLICNKCGYCLVGNTCSVCPECGTPISACQKQLIAKSTST